MSLRYVLDLAVNPCPFFFISVHHGQRRHLLAAHKIIHREVEKVINENIPTNKDAVAIADPDHPIEHDQ